MKPDEGGHVDSCHLEFCGVQTNRTQNEKGARSDASMAGDVRTEGETSSQDAAIGQKLPC